MDDAIFIKVWQALDQSDLSVRRIFYVIYDHKQNGRQKGMRCMLSKMRN